MIKESKTAVALGAARDWPPPLAQRKPAQPKPVRPRRTAPAEPDLAARWSLTRSGSFTLDSPVRALAVDRSGNRVWAAHQGGYVELREINQGGRIWQFGVGYMTATYPLCLAVSADEQWLMAGNSGGTIQHFQADDGRDARFIGPDVRWFPFDRDLEIVGIAVTPDSRASSAWR